MSRLDNSTDPGTRRRAAPRPLTLLAWVNVALHLAGLVLAAVGMRPGSPLVPLDERLSYLAAAPLGWTLGWACWMLCAAALIAFLAGVTFRMETPLARLALMIAVAGAAFDLFCDSVYIAAFPMMAAWQPTQERLFLAVEKITGIGSLVVANGAYSVAILIISVALRQRSGKDTPATYLGYAVGACGLVLGAAGFTGSAEHAMWATLPTMLLFCIWVVVLARRFEAAGETA